MSQADTLLQDIPALVRHPPSPVIGLLMDSPCSAALDPPVKAAISTVDPIFPRVPHEKRLATRCWPSMLGLIA